MIAIVAAKDITHAFEAAETQGDVMDREGCTSQKPLPDGRRVAMLCVTKEPKWPAGVEVLSRTGWRGVLGAIQMAVGAVAVVPDGKMLEEIAKARSVLTAAPKAEDLVVAAGQPWIRFQGVDDA